MNKRICLLMIVLLLLMVGCGYKGSSGDDETFKEDRENKILQVIPEKPVRIELRRNSKGAYSWSIRGEKADKIISADKKLRAYIKELNK